SFIDIHVQLEDASVGGGVPTDGKSEVSIQIWLSFEGHSCVQRLETYVQPSAYSLQVLWEALLCKFCYRRHALKHRKEESSIINRTSVLAYNPDPPS
ncbi:hypothetical protein Tco_1412580, partial [Tanacetum coccineum]